MHTDEMKAAYINSQAAMLNVRVAGMLAENHFDNHNNYPPTYRQADFDAVQKEFAELESNAVVGFFRG